MLHMLLALATHGKASLTSRIKVFIIFKVITSGFTNGNVLLKECMHIDEVQPANLEPISPVEIKMVDVRTLTNVVASLVLTVCFPKS